jgi:hypothetical protein
MDAFFGTEFITPMATVLQGFDELKNPSLGHNGAVVEACVEGLFYREPVEVLSPSLRAVAATQGMVEWYRSLVQRTLVWVETSRTAGHS